MCIPAAIDPVFVSAWCNRIPSEESYLDSCSMYRRQEGTGYWVFCRSGRKPINYGVLLQLPSNF